MVKAKARQSNTLRHSVIALVMVGLASAMMLRPWEETKLREHVIETRAEIAVEHDLAFTLSLALSIGKKPTFLDLSHESEGIVKISLPSEWSLREVRGTTLDSLSPEPPSAGFIRFAVPRGATISFLLPEAPSSLHLHNIQPAPHMSVRWKKIDLETGIVEENVTLISGEGGTIW